MDTIAISWRRGAAEPELFVGGASVGQGDAGVRRILETLRAHPQARVVLKIGEVSTGGADLLETTPLAGRTGEFRAALAGRSYIVEFE